MFRSLAPRSCALRRRVHNYFTNGYHTSTLSTHILNHEPKKGDKVVVGMSGGVDSSVSALLLAKEDYDLSAVYMRNWDTRDESGSDKGCEWEKDWEDVQRVCKVLDIPVTMVDLSKEYWNKVFEPSLRLWEQGRTPNTDVWCNREIKFGALLERLPGSTETTKPWLATGHYARKIWSHHLTGPPRPKLVRPADRHKDQTYYLSSITEDGLRRAMFPLHNLQKPEVRELARKYNLHNAERPDSVGICFVGERGKFKDFLAGYIPQNSGTIVDKMSGKVLGQHTGLWNYTIGEGARLPGMPARMTVSEKDTTTNTVYVVPGTSHDKLFSDVLSITGFQWIWRDAPPPELDSESGYRVQVMHRYRMKATPATIRRLPDGNLRIWSDKPEHAVTPGQAAAVYDGDWCLGCGLITSAARSSPLEGEVTPPA
ncbi:tRNA-specific 2-thiouridylase [Ephemerocybe angulata]|uniref:tRNA-5-taurinomethyluridine 2-sulfurtransferase n=1 Tax=Ephemerocybe angulata TaxID=980116 RepID=A0A8H6HRK7_9AGAR|nr:tRNA-specific 2-thiouridylase [Tulosesus angulatus]